MGKRITIDESANLFVITRRLDAPHEWVFAAFTDPEHLMRWWGPKGFRMVYCKLNLRPGGTIQYCAVSPMGIPVYGQFLFREITHCRRIVFVHSLTDGWPREILIKVSFSEEDQQTVLKLGVMIMNTKPNSFVPGCKQVIEGYNEALDQLEDYIAGLRSIKDAI
jgi:uncharacterized protein YndB with AHSA1/START domain